MKRNVSVYEVLIASPSDVPEERAIVREAVYEWNTIHSNQIGIVLLPIGWELDVFPELGDRPQEIINTQIVNDADLLIAIFWSRLGTPSGENLSGTAEEIQLFIDNNKPAMVYFGEKSLPYDSDLKQISEVKKFKTYCQSKGVTKTYRALTELKEQLVRNITQLVFKVAEHEKGLNIPISMLKNGASVNNYNYSDDVGRLRVQGDLLRSIDKKSISFGLDLLKDKSKINVLDVGCADGYVTVDRFKDNTNLTVNGIDINSNAIERANSEYAGLKNFSFKCVDIDSFKVPKNHYQFIFSVLTLHHLANPEGVIRKLWDSLDSGGVLLIRGADDGLKVNYPRAPELDFLLNSTNNIVGSSDRLFGRKLYTYVSRLLPKPRKIEMLFDIQSTVGLTSDERGEFYKDNYSFRVDYAEKAANAFSSCGDDVALFETLKNIDQVQRNRFCNEEDLFSINIQNVVVVQK